MNPIRKAQEKTSIGTSIRAYCYWCMGGSGGDESTQQSVTGMVRACHQQACPLWSVRGWRSSEQRQQEMKQAREREWPATREKIIASSRRHPESLRKSLNAKCFECVGGSDDPNPWKRVRECQNGDCGLHGVRPWQDTDSEADVKHALNTIATSLQELPEEKLSTHPLDKKTLRTA